MQVRLASASSIVIFATSLGAAGWSLLGLDAEGGSSDEPDRPGRVAGEQGSHSEPPARAAEGEDPSPESGSDPYPERLSGPVLEGWAGLVPVPPGATGAPHPGKLGLARARHRRAELYDSTGSKRGISGYARRGSLLAVARTARGSGCASGRWYREVGGGYLCTSRGFDVATVHEKLSLHISLPDPGEILPYQYGKVISNKALRLTHLPSEAEAADIAEADQGKRKYPKVVERVMEGAFFAALHVEVEHRGEKYYQTVRGRYVSKKFIDPFEPSEMHGVFLSDARKLPLAFVYGEDRPLYRLDDGDAEQTGVAEKHARFPLVREVQHDGKAFVVGPRGLMLERAGVRVVRQIKRPDEVPSGEKWIHVDLSEQALVAYEGDRPVLATIISSGRKGYEPPLGTYRVWAKHLTTTMDGPDPSEGWYEVEEVPWTMYYHGGYAVHGAYWHEDFGRPKSHGCTNVAPADARWLWYWADPKLPAGWHGKREAGTWVHFSS